MMKLLLAFLLIASPACAQTKPTAKSAGARADSCAPIGHTAKGELVYSIKCDNLPVSPSSRPQDEVREVPIPAPEPEVQRSGIFGWSYERKRPDQ
jgi:hypothetical protein